MHMLERIQLDSKLPFSISSKAIHAQNKKKQAVSPRQVIFCDAQVTFYTVDKGNPLHMLSLHEKKEILLK